MKATLIRTAAVTSLATALGVSALAYYVMPRLTSNQSLTTAYANTNNDPSNGVTLPPPAMYSGYDGYSTQPYFAGQQPVYMQPRPQLVRRTNSYSQPANVYTMPTQSSYPQSASYPQRSYPQSGRDAYGEPIRNHRSTGKSALIVAGSSGTGAAIGALAGGKRGAGIGALAGGAAGFIYDRMTANKK